MSEVQKNRTHTLFYHSVYLSPKFTLINREDTYQNLNIIQLIFCNNDI